MLRLRPIYFAIWTNKCTSDTGEPVKSDEVGEQGEAGIPGAFGAKRTTFSTSTPLCFLLKKLHQEMLLLKVTPRVTKVTKLHQEMLLKYVWTVYCCWQWGFKCFGQIQAWTTFQMFRRNTIFMTFLRKYQWYHIYCPMYNSLIVSYLKFKVLS